MKVQSKAEPEQLHIEKQDNVAKIIMCKNIEQVERETEEDEIEQLYQYDKVEFELPYRKTLDNSITDNFNAYFEFGKEQMERQQKLEKKRNEVGSLVSNYNLPDELRELMLGIVDSYEDAQKEITSLSLAIAELYEKLEDKEVI